MKQKHISANKNVKLEKHYSDTVDGESEDISRTTLDRMHRFVNIAKALFRKGYTSNGRTFNVTFACKRDKILAIGINDFTRIMPNYVRFLKTTYKQWGEQSYHPCIHSEMSAVLKLGSDSCYRLDFYNVRLDRNGHCCNSQPCKNCLRIIRMVEAKHIYYYDDDLNICRA